MNAEWLRDYLNELQCYLTNFKGIRDISKKNYQKQFDLIVDPERKALLIKEYFARSERQEKSIARMEKLHKEAVDRLLSFE